MSRSISSKLPTPPTVSVPFNQLWLNCFSWRHNRSEVEGHEKVIAMKLLVSSSTRSWLLLKPASFQLGDLQITTTVGEPSLHQVWPLEKEQLESDVVFYAYGVLDLDPWTLYPKLIDQSLIRTLHMKRHDGRKNMGYLFIWIIFCINSWRIVSFSATSNFLWMSIPTRKRGSMAIARFSAIQFTKFSEA